MEIAFILFNKKYHHVRMRQENGIIKLVLNTCKYMHFNKDNKNPALASYKRNKQS